MMIIDIVLGIILLVSSLTDIKDHKILNIVVFPGILAGFILNGYTQGWTGLIFSGEGFLAGFILLFIPFILGGIAAGDVKLLSTVGAIKGVIFVFYAFLGTSLFGAIIALLMILKRKEFLSTLKKFGAGLYITLASGKIGSPKNTELSEAKYIPYGVAITLGTISVYFLR